MIPSLEADRDEPFFGHLLHRVLRPFAAEPAVLDAGKRDQVDTAAGRLVDVHDADVQAFAPRSSLCRCRA